MSGRLFVGAALLILGLVTVLVLAPSLYESGESTCPTLQGENPGEPAYHEHDGSIGSNYSDATCPVDDGVGMGATG